MKGIGRKISLMAITTAVFLLVAARVVPHHHCLPAFAPSSAVSQLHIGFEECTACHGCEGSGNHSHENDEHQCFVDVELYFRVTAEDDCVAKKTYTPPAPFILYSLPIIVAPVNEGCEWYDLHIFKLKERAPFCKALRAPPVQVLCA